jgi:hypothetical protein
MSQVSVRSRVGNRRIRTKLAYLRSRGVSIVFCVVRPGFEHPDFYTTDFEDAIDAGLRMAEPDQIGSPRAQAAE